MTENEEKEIVRKFYQYYKYDKMNYFFSPDYNLLYHCKYGLNYVRKTLVKNEKKNSFIKNYLVNFKGLIK